VVELRFNTDLLEVKDDNTNNDDASTELAVYKGEVEFITLDEWAQELKILVEECCTHEEKKVYARPPEENRQPDAAAAWSKINQVYGRGTMEMYSGRHMTQVYDRLIHDRRVVNLLTPEPGASYKSVMVREGSVQAKDAKHLIQGFLETPARLRRLKKRWAHAFRQRINSYVYRSGNGEQPQTWPLIRKVVLEGPWSVLSTGACLVDLPGVKDANAARAKVSEKYLQNCNKIWVVAPIKRAVDDGTAKELMGEQFKRRLLMDGAYGSVSFICTQTDDCEATETMRDHQDVAMKLGLWETISDLSAQLGIIEGELADILQEEEDLKMKLDEAVETLQASRDELEELEEDYVEMVEAEDDDDNNVYDTSAVLKQKIQQLTDAKDRALRRLNKWKEENLEKRDALRTRAYKLQRKLKGKCAIVRNEYSKTCLQDDFRAGLEEILKPDDEDAPTQIQSPTPIPVDYQMDVYCISSNDYLKIQGIKPKTDGPPSTFQIEMHWTCLLHTFMLSHTCFLIDICRYIPTSN
jgi:hypothetical protein